MILEELLDCSSEKLEAMSDKELEDYFRPYFAVTRPEQAARRVSAVTTPAMSPEMQRKFKMAAQLGLDLGALKKRLKG